MTLCFANEFQTQRLSLHSRPNPISSVAHASCRKLTKQTSVIITHGHLGIHPANDTAPPRSHRFDVRPKPPALPVATNLAPPFEGPSPPHAIVVPSLRLLVVLGPSAPTYPRSLSNRDSLKPCSIHSRCPIRCSGDCRRLGLDRNPAGWFHASRVGKPGAGDDSEPTAKLPQSVGKFSFLQAGWPAAR